MKTFKQLREELCEARKTWKKINSYLLGKPAEVYTNDSGYTFGKVDGKWVMVDFDDEVIHTGKSAAEMKRYFNSNLTEATYQGKKVPLNKPMPGDVKKSKVYVDPDGDGKAKKVNFGDKNMKIKKNNPERRKSFRARHNCDNPGPKDKARYWSCKAW